jgi:synaptic vesicle membrane protein VAT-1
MSSSLWSKPQTSVMAFNLSYLFDQQELLAEAMAELLGLFGDKRLVPLSSRCFPLAEAAQAHRELETGTTVGKLVLVTSPPQPSA